LSGKTQKTDGERVDAFSYEHSVIGWVAADATARAYEAMSLAHLQKSCHNEDQLNGAQQMTINNESAPKKYGIEHAVVQDLGATVLFTYFDDRGNERHVAFPKEPMLSAETLDRIAEAERTKNSERLAGA
jgi:hypothetical protein